VEVKMKNPYEKNEYLKDDKEVVKEIKFFADFGLKGEQNLIQIQGEEYIDLSLDDENINEKE
jgi:hypothetical protein